MSDVLLIPHARRSGYFATIPLVPTLSFPAPFTEPLADRSGLGVSLDLPAFGLICVGFASGYYYGNFRAVGFEGRIRYSLFRSSGVLIG
jgi:hypothetical protein